MQKTILIVDDSESIRDFLQFTLERAGYNVLVGIHGEDALNFFKNYNTPIDMVLTDLHMPVMDGFELIKEIRKIKEFRRLPILFLTTETGAKQKERGREVGATGWISKPVTAEKIVNITKKVFKIRL